LNTKWNETQFATESRLKEEPNSVEEIHTLEHPFYESKNYSFSLLNDLFVLLEDLIDINWRQVFLY
jgi:hypothetical protein